MLNNPYYKSIHEYPKWILPFESAKSVNILTCFTNKYPFIVDIGCGAGNFLRDSATLYPNYNYVGFELRYKRLVKAAIKFQKKELTDIRLIQAKGEEIDHWFEENSIFKLHVNFPDPWPKKKQKKNRLLQEAYLEKIARLLQKGGYFFFKTDHSEYFFSTEEKIRKISTFEIIQYTKNLHHSIYNKNNILTEFEGIFQNQTLPIYFLCAKKV